MSDIEEDNVQPLQLHQVCKLLNSVSPQLEAIALRIELPDDLLDAIKQITDRVERIKTKPHTVAVVGRTGVGKSTLTCAMLKCAFLPSSSVVSMKLYSTRV
jgi:polynucleotide 5'-kinase involved in rRNA processing